MVPTVPDEPKDTIEHEIDTDSLPLPPPSSPPSGFESMVEPLNPEELKIQMDAIKKQLKNRRTYPEAAQKLKDLMAANLTYGNKRMFYDALSIVTFR